MKTTDEINRLISAMLFTGSLAAGYRLGAPDSIQLEVTQPAEFIAPAILLGLLLFSIWMLFDAIETGEPGAGEFNLQGMVRWTACGLFSGLLYGTLQVRWFDSVDERNFIRAAYESIGSLLIFLLVFWLIFQRTFWSISFKVKTRSYRWLGAVVLLAGLVVLVSGLLMASSIRSWSPFILIAVGFLFVGLGLVLLAVITIGGVRLAQKEPIGYTGGGLIVAGILFSLVGVLWH